ncbi:hypothetical protein JTB14_003783 [Gonioctena quinquepunctata]|nr:hypothetical protein JTB14_003783 [Gonioctena quinquepunctata]
MIWNLVSIYATLCLFIGSTAGARILAIVFSPSYSHQITFRPLWRALADRGHHITLLTTDPMRDPTQENIREIDLSGSYGVMEKHGNSDILSKKRSETKYKYLLELEILDVLDKVADWQLDQSEVKNLIGNRSETFDLLIVEVMKPIHMAFSERFNVPFIGVTSQEAPSRIHAILGNYMHPVLYPDQYFPFTQPLSLQHRLLSTLLYVFTWYYQYAWRYHEETRIARKHFGEGVRDLWEIERDMSMLFVNVNPFFQDVRPSGMNTIYLGGGMHIEKAKPLPKELQEFLQSGAENGVIYFSLGSNVKSSLITGNLRNQFLGTFAELPHKVLWKFETSLDNLPPNVKIIKWAPQQDILADHRVKLFITQCGLQSIEEAIFNEVPMVGMPFMWDQPYNGGILQRKRLGLTVDITNVTKETFKNTILEVINNPVYKKNIKKISKLTRDVEKTGLERALWWTEYCLRTDGAKHLRRNFDIPSYQVYLLDVYAILFIAGVVFIYTVAVVFKSVCRTLLGWKRSRKTKKE